jgi:hypothetical protein
MRNSLEELRKYLESAAGCDSRTWRTLVSCNLPKNRKGYIPLLDKAMSKGIIPQDYAKAYFSEIKRQEEEIKSKGFTPLYIAFCGDIGNYKTLMAVRLFTIKTVTEKLCPLFLTNDELLALSEGSLEIHRYTDEITFAVETELKPAKTFDDYIERVPFTAITKFYDIILVDDLEENAVPAFEKLVIQAYDTESYVITTTNIAPPRKLLELLSKKARSRLLECGIAIHVTGTDKRGGAR